MGQPCLGFPEFTRFFNPPHGEKLQLGMDFPMAIGTKEFALLKLRSNPLPTSSVTFVRNPEVFIRGFKMMDLQRLSTSVITAASTSAT
jgi:hypothetical protein